MPSGGLYMTNANLQHGNTALHNAACIGNLEIAQILVEEGADVLLKDQVSLLLPPVMTSSFVQDGLTPLDEAIEYEVTLL